ncbi:DUF4845 domain-containing protein [Parathalassolituus penaei]|uniref:DUF4845 domain-containing protein n=1 Tax=Parathalassolituus penaei TaxID=2997323 RepID=A0A9X3EKF0_9GAMM|nr:DUF4845 domain-containing protein [Parathalassolituus penaei]MCY0965941.1 DUF4845 domain-containing protein [Parathalassolituus penaei]
MKKQGGMSFLAMLLAMLIGGMAIKAALALGPMYYDDMLLKKIFENLHETSRINEKTSPKDFKRILEERMDANNIDYIPLDTMVFSKGPGVLRVDFEYQISAQFIGAIEFTTSFAHHEEYQ